MKKQMVAVVSVFGTICFLMSCAGDGGSGGQCSEGEKNCLSDIVQVCENGEWRAFEDCSLFGLSCVESGNAASCMADAGDIDTVADNDGADVMPEGTVDDEDVTGSDDDAAAPVTCTENDRIDCFGTKLYQCINGYWTLLTDCAANNMKCVKPPSGPASCVAMICGDGSVDTEIGEVCEREQTGDCKELSEGYYDEGTATCKLDCTGYDFSDCIRFCGNGQTDNGEVCDGNVSLCRSVDSSYYSGKAVCKEDCSGYDVSACQIECPNNNLFCHEHNGKYWTDPLSPEWESTCQSLGGRVPTISELRTLVQNCPSLETGGDCNVTDSCLTQTCQTAGCQGCLVPNSGNFSFSVLGDYGVLRSNSPAPSTGFPMAWGIDFGMPFSPDLQVQLVPMATSVGFRCVK